jgi:putative sterol carrier protein
VVAVVATVAAPLPVHRDESAESGFARIVEQFLSQSLVESEDKQRRAARLRGRMAMTASDRGYTVTLVFAGDSISILDGGAEPLDASIVGPYETLVDLIQGEDSPLRAHLGRRIKVKSRLRKLLFPLHVHNLMKLENDDEHSPSSIFAGVRDAAFLGGALVIAVALLMRAT